MFDRETHPQPQGRPSGDPPAASAPSGHAPIRTWDTQHLFGEAREIRLRHGDAEYRLMITRQGKLLLVK